MGFFLIVLLVALGVAVKVGLDDRRRAEIESARNIIAKLVADHLPTLARRRLALIKVDPYGVVDTLAWQRECQHFVDKVVRPRLSHAQARAILTGSLIDLVTELIEEPARKECARLEASLAYSDEMSPLEFERYCAGCLESAGWACELTKGSGDQGVDILARKEGTVLVIQCKKYGSPVGNSAVQEIVAAKMHVKAHFAAVVSNAPFTRSAVELATSTRTLLLHHTELDTIDTRLRTV